MTAPLPSPAPAKLTPLARHCEAENLRFLVDLMRFKRDFDGRGGFAERRERLDQLWAADITYIPTGSDFLYLSVVVDAWSRRVVGWYMKTHLKTDLVLDALNMALQQRRPDEVRHHSDQGTTRP